MLSGMEVRMQRVFALFLLVGLLFTIDYLTKEKVGEASDGKPAPNTEARAGASLREQGRLLAAVVLDPHRTLFFGIPEGQKQVQVFMGHGPVSLSDPRDMRQLKKVPPLSRGLSVVRLDSGRVLVAGSDSQASKSTWLYDADKDLWQRSGDLDTARSHPALAALPGGGAFAGGTSALVADSAAAYRAELWDPASGRWRRLPDLPLSFRVDALRAKGPSAVALPDGSIAMGGGMHGHIALLRARDGGFPDGSQWTIPASLMKPRMGAELRPMNNSQSILITGGVEIDSEGRCCVDSDGVAKLEWAGDGNSRFTSLGLDREEPIVAHRGELSFVTGGWETISAGTTGIQPSAVVELVDRRSGRAQQLPPLPAPALVGAALWLDEQRILVKAVAQTGEYESHSQGMARHELETDAAGFLALYDRRGKAWKTLNDPRLDRAQLIGMSGGQALLTSPDGQAWSVSLDGFGIRGLPSPPRAREGFITRRLADGRILIAGGTEQIQRILMDTPDCQSDDCPDVYRGYGPLEPAYRHAWYRPDTGQWEESAPSLGAGTDAILRADGSVWKIGTPAPAADDAPAADTVLEVFDPTGGWRQVPWPKEDMPCRHRLDACQLLLAATPDGSTEIPALRIRSDDGQQVHYELWAYDEAQGQWHEAAKDMTRREFSEHAWPLIERDEGMEPWGRQLQIGTAFLEWRPVVPKRRE